MARRHGGNGDSEQGPSAPYPPIDIVDMGSNLLVKALVPGVARDDLEIVVEGARLTLRGRRPAEAEHGAFHRHERPMGGFERTVELPAAIDPDRTHARLHNGLLELTLAKRGPGVPHRVQVH